MTLKSQFIKKIEWDVINWPRKNNFKNIFFSNLENLCVYGEYAKREKSVKIKHVSVDNRIP